MTVYPGYPVSSCRSYVSISDGHRWTVHMCTEGFGVLARAPLPIGEHTREPPRQIYADNMLYCRIKRRLFSTLSLSPVLVPSPSSLSISCTVQKLEWS